jgi:hypothetical protein
MQLRTFNSNKKNSKDYPDGQPTTADHFDIAIGARYYL